MLRISNSAARAAIIRRTSAASRLAASRWGGVERALIQTRSLHERRALLYPVEEGLGEFLPPQALKTVGVEYQQGLLDRLNDEVKGTEEENQSIVDTIINTSNIREKTLAFNYASLALNNGFFLDHLKPPPSPPLENYQNEISQPLASAIRQQHGSIAQLKSSFSAAVNGMFTSGYIWFVSDKSGNTGVLPTFGPGTLLIRSRSYMATSKGLVLGDNLAQWDRTGPAVESTAAPATQAQNEGQPRQSPTSQTAPPGVSPSSPTSGMSGSGSTNPNTSSPHSRFIHTTPRYPQTHDLNRPASSFWDISAPSSSSSIPSSSPFGSTSTDLSSAHSKRSNKVDILNIGDVLYPLFCISVHEHNWLSAGYGVWGKEEWLKQFWTVLDWEKVSRSYDRIGGGVSF